MFSWNQYRIFYAFEKIRFFPWHTRFTPFYTNCVIIEVGAKLRLTNIVLKRIIGVHFAQSNLFSSVKIKSGYRVLIEKEVKTHGNLSSK